MEIVTEQSPISSAQIFSSDFLKLSPESISSQLQKNGYFLFPNAVNLDFVNKILNESAGQNLLYNTNDVGPVRYFRQTFFSHILAQSPSVMKIITSPYVMDICRAYLGPLFRLKCQRYYESGFGYQLGWHTDNKTVDNEKTNVRGLVFIVYLNDTIDGELEVVEGSNNWSGEALSNDFKDEELRQNHPDLILSLAGKQGSLVITDTYTIHRTKLITTPGFNRKSLFFQIDDDLNHSEKIIVNTEYLPKMTEELMRYLGFGLPSGYKSMPISGINTLNKSDLKNLMIRACIEYASRTKPAQIFAKIFRSNKPINSKNVNAINDYN